MAVAGVLLAAAFLTTASSAWAEPSTLCVKATKTATKPKHYTGGYTNKTCTAVSATNEGEYEKLADFSTSEETELKALLKYVKVEASGIDSKPTVQFTGANVQIVNGAGRTETTNGEGNLVIGYDENPGTERGGWFYGGTATPGKQTGSHNLILGEEQEFTSYGGIDAGYLGSITAPGASVTGGALNTASGGDSWVSGGWRNTASGPGASVSGGLLNTASGPEASVSGGAFNLVEYSAASISGGCENTAGAKRAHSFACASGAPAGSFASVSGGEYNAAETLDASISGGDENKASGQAASISGGVYGEAVGKWDSVSGGFKNKVKGTEADSISGGIENEVTAPYQGWIGGGGQNLVSGNYGAIFGGHGLKVTGAFGYEP